MRWFLSALLLAFPANAAELCVLGGESICCHPMCDVFSPVQPSGYATEGLPSCGAWETEFTISSSDTDPFQSEGPLPAFAPLYLWVNADSGYGFQAGHVQLGGDLTIFSFEPLIPGASWDPVEQEAQINLCTYESVVVARFGVFPPVSVEPDSWGRIKALYRR